MTSTILARRRSCCGGVTGGQGWVRVGRSRVDQAVASMLQREIEVDMLRNFELTLTP